MRNRPAAGGRFPKQKHQPSSLLPPIPAERSSGPSPTPSPTPSLTTKQRKQRPQEAESPEKPVRPLGKEPKSKPKPSVPIIVEHSEDSADISDSDPEENYLNFSFQQFNVDQVKKRVRKGSGSESSMTSSISEEGTSTHSVKRPMATPRKQKSVKSESAIRPPLPPRPEDKEASPRPPLPPRPVDVPKIRKHKSLEEPARPNRPRKSEIKRAKNRARAAKNTAPSLMIVDEDGLETMSNATSKSSKSYTTSKSAPPLAIATPKRRTNTVSTESDTFLSPHVQQRPRRKSTPDESHYDPSSLPNTTVGSLDESMLGGSGLNSSAVAGTLLKMIMSSEDPGLKAALRELIAQDSDINSVHSNQ